MVTDVIKRHWGPPASKTSNSKLSNQGQVVSMQDFLLRRELNWAAQNPRLSRGLDKAALIKYQGLLYICRRASKVIWFFLSELDNCWIKTIYLYFVTTHRVTMPRARNQEVLQKCSYAHNAAIAWTWPSGKLLLFALPKHPESCVLGSRPQKATVVTICRLSITYFSCQHLNQYCRLNDCCVWIESGNEFTDAVAAQSLGFRRVGRTQNCDGRTPLCALKERSVLQAWLCCCMP